MSELPPTPRLCDFVYYFDEDKQPHAAIVAHVHDKLSLPANGRPICNLTMFKRDGKIANRLHVEPAYFNDTTQVWVLMNKWAWPDEVPDSAFNHLPPPKLRVMKVGAGEHIPTH